MRATSFFIFTTLLMLMVYSGVHGNVSAELEQRVRDVAGTLSSSACRAGSVTAIFHYTNTVTSDQAACTGLDNILFKSSFMIGTGCNEDDYKKITDAVCDTGPKPVPDSAPESCTGTTTLNAIKSALSNPQLVCNTMKKDQFRSSFTAENVFTVEEYNVLKDAVCDAKRTSTLNAIKSALSSKDVCDAFKEDQFKTLFTSQDVFFESDYNKIRDSVCDTQETATLNEIKTALSANEACDVVKSDQFKNLFTVRNVVFEEEYRKIKDSVCDKDEISTLNDLTAALANKEVCKVVQQDTFKSLFTVQNRLFFEDNYNKIKDSVCDAKGTAALNVIKTALSNGEVCQVVKLDEFKSLFTAHNVFFEDNYNKIKESVCHTQETVTMNAITAILSHHEVCDSFKQDDFKSLFTIQNQFFEDNYVKIKDSVCRADRTVTLNAIQTALSNNDICDVVTKDQFKSLFTDRNHFFEHSYNKIKGAVCDVDDTATLNAIKTILSNKDVCSAFKQEQFKTLFTARSVFFEDSYSKIKAAVCSPSTGNCTTEHSLVEKLMALKDIFPNKAVCDAVKQDQFKALFTANNIFFEDDYNKIKNSVCAKSSDNCRGNETARLNNIKMVLSNEKLCDAVEHEEFKELFTAENVFLEEEYNKFKEAVCKTPSHNCTTMFNYTKMISPHEELCDVAKLDRLRSEFMTDHGFTEDEYKEVKFVVCNTSSDNSTSILNATFSDREVCRAVRQDLFQAVCTLFTEHTLPLNTSNKGTGIVNLSTVTIATSYLVARLFLGS